MDNSKHLANALYYYLANNRAAAAATAKGSNCEAGIAVGAATGAEAAGVGSNAGLYPAAVLVE